MTATQLPKLRPVDPRPITHDGRPSILLRDPLQLTDKGVMIPQQLGPFLALCDGTRDIGGLQASLAIRYGLRIGADVLEQFVTALDEALLLDNDRFAQAQEQALAEYRQAPFRTPTGAGRSYPGNADELRRKLNSYLETVDADPRHLADIRGLVSPHIDYERGGPVYAAVWKYAMDAAKAADLVVLLGTDHYGDNLVTLTRQHYSTPFGVLPTAQGIVDALAEAVGPGEAFADELLHRNEHSIELAAAWLHHVRGGQPCEVVPILCGSFSRFVRGEAEPAHDPTIQALTDTLKQSIAGRRTLVVAAADLAHVGPAFGSAPQGLMERAYLQTADEALIERICAGDAEGFFESIQQQGDRYSICGLPPIYLALRVLETTTGQKVAYDRCPADENGTSLVSICGVLLGN
ncbi:MAG: AmmeMemoRadiSam system protein B, partial [Anaerolineae bacterium]|nr:AmmeMemoRadiSam system protein B [Anaerolineae bacterium]